MISFDKNCHFGGRLLQKGAVSISIYNRNLGPGGTDAVHFGPPATPIGGRASSRRPRTRHFGFRDPLFLSFACALCLEFFFAPPRAQRGPKKVPTWVDLGAFRVLFWWMFGFCSGGFIRRQYFSNSHRSLMNIRSTERPKTIGKNWRFFKICVFAS